MHMQGGYAAYAKHTMRLGMQLSSICLLCYTFTDQN